MFIEKAKREFIEEISRVNCKLQCFENLAERVNVIEDRLQNKESEISAKFETLLLKHETSYSHRQSEIKIKLDDDSEKIK